MMAQAIDFGGLGLHEEPGLQAAVDEVRGGA
jgi:hypothetical protein